MKVCTECAIEQPKTNFYKHLLGKEGLRSDCKTCNNKRVVKWQKENPDRARNIWLRKRYGITSKQYNTMFVKQNGNCSICKTHQSTLKKALAVDHCHVTKKVRGLLCDACNVMLGRAKDNITILREAILYLEEGKLDE